MFKRQRKEVTKEEFLRVLKLVEWRVWERGKNLANVCFQLKKVFNIYF